MRIKKMLAILTAAMMAVAVAGCSASTQGGSDTGKETGKEDAGAASEADGKEAEQAKDSNRAAGKEYIPDDPLSWFGDHQPDG